MDDVATESPRTYNLAGQYESAVSQEDMTSQPPPESDDKYPPEFFDRHDESEDELFYSEPRLVVHIDEYAISAIGRYFSDALPKDSVMLDLMSSWRSHLSEGFPKRRLVGLGMNSLELAENPQLDEGVVHNLNTVPELPFEADLFDAAFVVVSIQYMVRPVDVFREVNRILKDGASFHVIYSNRMFPTKAVAVWQALNDPQKAQLVASYFANSEGWDTPKAMDISPRLEFQTDPAYVVSASKRRQQGDA